LPQFHAGLLKQTAYGYTGATPYARVGNYLVVLLALAAIAVAGALQLRRAPAAD
jgi:apolipoprotein N-acyltransferase